MLQLSVAALALAGCGDMDDLGTADIDDEVDFASLDAVGDPQAGPGVLTLVVTADVVPEVHQSLVRGLDRWLEGVEGLDRSSAINELATSTDQSLRAVSAMALENTRPVLGATWCLDVLSRDTSPIVRRAAARSAFARFAESPKEYRRILAMLSDDRDRTVAHEAQRLLPDDRA